MDRIVLLYWDNIDPRVVQAQRKVFAHFGVSNDQRERTGLDHGNKPFNIEQISISESFRLHSTVVAEMRPLFQHYCRRSVKRYMHWCIERWLKREPDFKIVGPFIAHSRNQVRIFNYVNQITKKY